MFDMVKVLFYEREMHLEVESFHQPKEEGNGSHELPDGNGCGGGRLPPPPPPSPPS